MKKLNFTSVLLAFSFVFMSASAIAGEMSNDEYKAHKDRIEASYKIAKEKCDSLSGNAEDICVEEAKGRRNVEKANLEVKYKPSNKTEYEARIAKIDAEYLVAKEKCDNFNSNAKDLCVAEANAAKVQATNDAKAQLKP